MRTASRFVIVLLFLGVVLRNLWVFYQLGQMKEMMSQPQPPAIISVTTTTENWQPAIKAVGSITAINGIEVANEVPGVIESIGFESGDTVNKGDVLVRLDAAIDEAALRTRRAEAQLAEQEQAGFGSAAEGPCLSPSMMRPRPISMPPEPVNEADSAQQEGDSRALRWQAGYPHGGSGSVRCHRHTDRRDQHAEPYLCGLHPVREISPDVDQGYPVSVTLAVVPDQSFEGEVSAINTGKPGNPYRAYTRHPG